LFEAVKIFLGDPLIQKRKSSKFEQDFRPCLNLISTSDF